MDATTDTTTPTTTTETTTPAAPATSEPSSSAAVSERPTNARELASFLAKTDAPESAPAAATTAPAATVQGQPGPDPGSTATAPRGSMLVADHQKVLANARQKERAAAQAEFDRQYGWAKQVPRESVQRMGELADRLQKDPVGFLNQLHQELAQHPTYGQQLRTTGGRLPAAAGQPGAIAPDIEVHDAQGRVVGMTYSDTMLARRDAALAQQIKAELLQTVQPLRDAHDRAAQQARLEESARQVNAEADVILERIDSILEGRKDLYPEVNRLMTDGLDAYDAAIMVMRQHVAPARSATAQRTAVATMQKKAAGNTANGASTSVAATTRPKNSRELASFLANLERGR
jgi:hypothetical protein